MMDYYQNVNNESNKDDAKENTQVKEKVKTGCILYIGNLPIDIDNFEVFELLTKSGKFTVDSMNIKKTGAGAYAYVKLGSKKEVQEARKKLNLMTYKNRIIKADLFIKEEKRLQNISSKIFFKGFKKSSDLKEILDFFTSIGEVAIFKPKISVQGEFEGSGSVLYSKEEDAMRAINEFNSIEYKGSKLLVMKFVPLDPKSKQLSSFPVVLIRNIPSYIDSDEKLKELLSSFSNIIICGLFKEPIEGTYQVVVSGISLLPSSEEVEKCLMNSRNSDINTMHVEINRAAHNQVNIQRLIEIKKNSLKSKYEGSNLVVKNLPKELDEKDLYKLFTEFGKVKSAKIMTEGVTREKKDINGMIIDREYVYESKGIAFVLFYDPSSARNALETLNSNPIIYNSQSLLLKIEYFNYDKEKNPMLKNKKEVKGNQENYNKPHNQNRQNNQQRQQNHNQINNHQIHQNPNFNQNPHQNQIQQERQNQMFNQQNQFMIIMNQLQQELIAIVKYLSTINPEDQERQEKIGEVLYEYILKLIDIFNLNTLNKPDITNQLISMKVTGILLQSDVNLSEILSDLNNLVATLRDLISRIYLNN